MKTKQEQTKQMLKTLCDKFQCSAIDRSYMAKSCRQCEDIIEALHEAGYGDVTEYKAEIERLKTENEQLEEDIDMIIKEQKDDRKFDIKQAKIDILNKVKEKCKFDGYIVAVYKNDIDELIKEVETEQYNSEN